ncbi:MAG: carbon-nitrogen hydrolase family protein, partial [Bacteroidia bacterium]|nr:carbon-nitrogen hydrolase family protein [Bacteroidia bacterium]
MSEKLKVGFAQISPVWLDKEATLDKVSRYVIKASGESCDLVVFGEALVPGYPFWLALTGGAEWNTELNKKLHAHYLANAITIENGDLNALCKLASENQIAMYLGVIERPLDRGGHSIYASLVYIDKQGRIQSVHRKLQPTYDERLSWASGDGHGLKTHKLESFTVGGLNCWENWMPLPRAALYAQGEDLHVAVWPGSDHNTRDIT